MVGLLVRAVVLPGLLIGVVAAPFGGGGGATAAPVVLGSRSAPLDICAGNLLAGCLRHPAFPVRPGPTQNLPDLPPPPPSDCALPGMDDRCETWAAMYDNPNGYGGSGFDQGLGVAAGGGRVFATGGSWDDETNHYDALTAAYDDTTGERLWSARDDGPAHTLDAGYAVAADRGSVFVTGTTDGDVTEGGALLTFARDAATGALRWTSRYDGPASGTTGRALALDPAGRFVFVTGSGHSATGGHDMVTVAYDATTGKEHWAAHYDGPVGGDDFAFSVEASDDAVFVTGPSWGGGGALDFDYATIAYAVSDDPATAEDDAGRRLWVARYDGGIRGDDQSTSVGIGDDGSKVYVTGGSARPQTEVVGAPPYAFTTIAYDADTGAQLWLTRYEPRPVIGSGQSFANSLAVGDGRVIAAGIAPGPAPNSDYGFATVAYDAVSGAQLWASPFHPPGSTYGIATSVAMTPDGKRVVTTGPSFEGFFTYKGDVATVAYDAASGSQRWAAKFTRVADDVADLLPYPSFAAVSPDGERAVVTGTYVNYCCDPETGLTSNFSDYWTLSYEI